MGLFPFLLHIISSFELVRLKPLHEVSNYIIGSNPVLYLECDGCGYAIGNDPERYKDKTLMAKIVPSGGFFSSCCLLFASITRKVCT